MLPTGPREVYDRVASRYADAFLDELGRKPLDRALLDVFAAEVVGRGTVADLGTGPGQVARYLHDRGVDVVGIDLAPGMVAEASARHPGIAFRAGDLRALDLADGALAGATLFYAIVHFEPDELAGVFRELCRALAPGAPALLAFHVGEGTLVPEEFLGERVGLAWRFFPLATVAAVLEAAGLRVEMRLERAAYPGEHPSVRGYVLARRP